MLCISPQLGPNLHTPLCPSDKALTMLWIPYFVRPQFACRTPKILKILTFFHGAAETSRLTWRNPFGHRSTQNAILGQIDQNSPSQP